MSSPKLEPKHNVFVHKTKNNRNGIRNACTEQKNDTSYIGKNKHIKKGCVIMSNINANTIGQVFQDIISKKRKNLMVYNKLCKFRDRCRRQ